MSTDQISDFLTFIEHVQAGDITLTTITDGHPGAHRSMLPTEPSPGLPSSMQVELRPDAEQAVAALRIEQRIVFGVDPGFSPASRDENEMQRVRQWVATRLAMQFNHVEDLTRHHRVCATLAERVGIFPPEVVTQAGVRLTAITYERTGRVIPKNIPAWAFALWLLVCRATRHEPMPEWDEVNTAWQQWNETAKELWQVEQ